MWKPNSSLYQIGVSAIMTGMVLLYPSTIDLADSTTSSASGAIHYSVSTSAAEVANHPNLSTKVPINVSLHHFNQIHKSDHPSEASDIQQVSDPIVSPYTKTIVVKKEQDQQTGQQTGSSVKEDNQAKANKTTSAATSSKENRQTTAPAPAKVTKKSAPKHKQTKPETAKTDKKTTVQSHAKTASATSSNVIDIAKSLIGTPYKWGGTSPSGFDCSGFVDYVFAKAGIDLPRTANSIWYGAGTKVSSPQAGDLIFFTHTYQTSSTATHVGIYIGGGRFIHAGSGGVEISSLYGEGGYWQNHYLGVKSVN